jgi:hypothetical protein
VSEDSSKEKFSNALIHILSDWKLMLKFWVFTSGMLLIACGGISLLSHVIRPLIPGARITTTQSGAQIIELGGKRSIQWLYSASSKPSKEPLNKMPGDLIWSNSGISVSKGDRVTLRVSGAVNLGIHHLVKSAENDTVPFFHWAGPDGFPSRKEDRPVDKYRWNMRIAGSELPGMLLMQVVPPGKEPNVRPNPEMLYPVGSGGKSPFNIRQSGTLYFTLNEVPLDKEMEKYYVISPDIDAEYVKEHPVNKQKKSWKAVAEQEYWNLWFDDNVGSLLVVAEIE